MPIPETLRRLLTAAGPSGYEQAPAAVFRDAASAFAEVTNDSVGSTVARVSGTGSGKLVAVVGHIDEIGLIVHHIDDDGFLWFTGVGGWDPVILVGQRVEIATRDGVVPGVVGKKPIHLLRDPEERKKAPELKNLHIDIGAQDGDDARSRVRIGDVAVISGEPIELPNGRVVSRSMDNRIGCYVALEAARLVAEAGGAPGDVAAVAVAQEEITFGGAHTTGLLAAAGRRDRGRRDVRDQPARARREAARPAPLRQRRRAHARLDAGPDDLRAALRGGRGGGHPVHRVARAPGRRAPTRTPCTSRAAASRAPSSPSRCATCTRRSRWCSSTTWRTPRS